MSGMESLLFLPSPYLVEPEPFFLEVPAGLPIAAVVERYMNPFGWDSSAYWTTPLGKVFLRYRRLVGAEFYREEVDKTYPYFKTPRSFKKLVRAEVDLWRAVLRLIERLNTQHLFTGHPAFIFYQIIEESVLVTPYALSEKIKGEKTGHEHFKSIQSENRLLQDCKNPFVEAHETTFTLVNLATQIAEDPRKSRFKEEAWYPVVRRRMAICSYLDKAGLKKVNQQGKVERRGRPKNKPPSKSRSP